MPDVDYQQEVGDDIPGMLPSGNSNAGESADDLVPVAESIPSKEASRRVDQRFRVRWKAGVVLGEGPSRKITMMRTQDISLGGMAVLAHDRVPPAEQYRFLVAMPPVTAGEKDIVVEIMGKIVYSVLDTAKGCFRLGVRFLEVKGEGKKLLRDRLEKHHVPTGSSN